MRALLVTHNYPRAAGDAAGAFVHRLAVALRGVGVEVRVVAPSAGVAPADDRVDGVPVTRFRYAPRAWETLAYEGTMAEQVATSWRGKAALLGLIVGAGRAVRRAIDDWRPDVVHAHWWFPCGIGAAASAGDVPLVVTMHGSDVRLGIATRGARPMYRYVAHRAARVLAVSPSLATAARAWADDVRVGVAPAPVDADAFPAGPATRRSSVLFVGRLNAQKGIADAIRAFAALGGEATLDVAGGGPDRAAAESLARALGVADRVRFHGPVPHAALGAMYRAAAVVAMPSREEGLGLVAIEAILSGAAVVGYDSGGLRDIVVPGETGVLVAPGDVAALSAALASVIAARPAGLAAGREALLATYSPVATAARYAAVYREVVA